MQRMIMDRVKALLKDGIGDRVLGWESGEQFYDRAPAFFTAENIDSLVYDDYCGANVTKYLVAEAAKEGKVIALIKPCDSFSLNQLCTEHRVNRDKVYALGIYCNGKLDVEKLRQKGIKGFTSIDDTEAERLKVQTLYGEQEIARKDVLLDKCLSCKGKYQQGVDEEIGQSVDTFDGDRYEEVKRLETMTPDERFAFWRKELSKCIRCNACRNVCPACSCVKCVFDNPETGVAQKAAADDFEENMFHIIRAFHVAGRCTDCGECGRVCPQGIPLHLLNRKFIKDYNELYGWYQAGTEIGQTNPLIEFTQQDAEPSVNLNKGGDK